MNAVAAPVRLSAAPGAVPDPGPAAASPRRLPRSPGFVAGLCIVAFLAVAAIAGPALVRADPAAQDLLARYQPPVGFGGAAAHPLGTDGLGRDMLARLIAGARVSLLIGLAATLAAGLLGVTVGVAGGWFGGRAEAVATWLTDVQAIVPFIVVAVAVAAAAGNTIGGVLLTLALTGWVGYARVTGLQARALRHAGWVEAARALGASPAAIVARHVLPGLAGAIAILATQQVSALILHEAALSYLGLGLGGNVVTWGRMAADGQQAIWVAPWVAAFPGIAVALAVLGFNLIGDAVAARAAAAR
ncbi:MAG: ABC transporter permease [Chloroflexota bacterium]